jgi:hypothetical protein
MGAGVGFSEPPNAKSPVRDGRVFDGPLLAAHLNQLNIFLQK